MVSKPNFYETYKMEKKILEVDIPLYDGESCDLRRKQTYLEKLNLWKVVEEDDDIVLQNPIR